MAIIVTVPRLLLHSEKAIRSSPTNVLVWMRARANLRPMQQIQLELNCSVPLTGKSVCPYPNEDPVRFDRTILSMRRLQSVAAHHVVVSLFAILPIGSVPSAFLFSVLYSEAIRSCRGRRKRFLRLRTMNG